jgi:hypothetical protein
MITGVSGIVGCKGGLGGGELDLEYKKKYICAPFNI